ncbi:dipeptidase [Anaerosalibacter massiliensis]|uniref:Membrane dipeptidase n=1 Tax=Anaerosalibacter massiliensis TaxID=1347392 RepID=A0A9X2MNS3_9FIRM|nr:membrane dipeptidase [Anaerosalibacter massiliensis]MCR2044406.1 membrane dipeptidase [Anaerosalibacter massiliensis]
MIFDCHGDIWTDVTVQRSKGMKNIIKNRHLDRFKKGNIIGGIFVLWTDPPHDKTPRKRLLEMVEATAAEIMENQDILRIILEKEDFNKALNEEKLAVIIGAEGLSGIGKNIDLINALYLFGLRHASLTWNEENLLATGVRGNPKRGVTELGKKALHLMEQLGVIVDVSHANDKTFWDIYENTTKPFIASHSNCRALCNVKRNLSDEQLKAIRERDGFIGLNSFNEFVHLDKDKQDLKHLVNHLDHMVEIMGVDHVGFGFDFFDFLENNTTDDFVEGNTIGTLGFENASKTHNLIEEMKNRGYSKEDIEKISYKNFYRIIEELI